MAVLFIAESCATGKKIYAQEKPTIEDLAGTWVNTEMVFDKGVIKNDGTSEYYKYLTVDIPYPVFTYTIEDSWVDKKGNKFFKVFKIEVPGPIHFFELVRINESGTVLEVNIIMDSLYKIGDDISKKFPSEINPRSFEDSYYIYYRQ